MRGGRLRRGGAVALSQARWARPSAGAGAGPGTGVVMNLILDRDRCAVPFDEHGAVEGEPEHGASVQPAVNVSAGDLGQCFGHEVDEVDEERADVADDRSLEGGRRL